ncbi:MAG: hypothetical protein ACRDAG_03825, partial [Cetobacterium somerae]
IVTNYSEDGKFIDTQNYLNEILDSTTIYLSDENVYRFISYYPNGNIKEEGYYIYEDNYNNDISWIGNHNFYSEEGELIEYEK